MRARDIDKKWADRDNKCLNLDTRREGFASKIGVGAVTRTLTSGFRRMLDTFFAHRFKSSACLRPYMC